MYFYSTIIHAHVMGDKFHDVIEGPASPKSLLIRLKLIYLLKLIAAIRGLKESCLLSLDITD